MARELTARLGLPVDGVAQALGDEEAPPAVRSWAATVPESAVPSTVLGSLHEDLLDPAERRRRGAHHTDPAVADALLAWALDGWAGWADPEAPLTALDPAVGGGALLLAVARARVAAGAEPAAVRAGLWGIDIDPLAVAVADVALDLWLAETGTAAPRTSIRTQAHGDALAGAADRLARVDLVVANPPFLGQLSSATARDRAAASALRTRFGAAAGGYVDAAGVFLLAATRWVRPGGRIVMIVPTSLLGARDAERVRQAVAEQADLVGLWVADGPAFAASVDVGAVVLEMPSAPPAALARASAGGSDERRVALASGLAAASVGTAPVPDASSWAPLLASVHGVPEVLLRGEATLGQVAQLHAGFRQHFYGVAAHLAEQPDDGVGDPDRPPVLTTGSVDPLGHAWGRRPARIAGIRWQRPVVDLAALEVTDPPVAAWVRARLRPKLLLAGQTKVVELVVDADGRFVPGVPLVTVEPLAASEGGLDEEPDLLLWMLAAALSAPPITAWALRASLGTARQRQSLKLAARQAREIPLPVDRERWVEVAEALRDGRPLEDAGEDLTEAYGLPGGEPVVAWWRARLGR